MGRRRRRWRILWGRQRIFYFECLWGGGGVADPTMLETIDRMNVVTTRLAMVR